MYNTVINENAIRIFGTTNQHRRPDEQADFCGGVRVTIERTQFVKMMNGSSDASNVVSGVVSGVVSDVVSLSVVHRTVQRDLAAMQRKGVMIREGITSAGHWVVLTEKINGWQKR